MKLKKFLPLILLALVVLYAFLPDSGSDVSTAPVESSESLLETIVESVEEVTEDKNEAASQVEDYPLIDYEGSYTTKEDVALYIHSYGCLPKNFVTKDEAEDAGWSGGSMEKYLPGMAIGGDRFGNREGLLPDAPGRKWTECDINTLGASGRGAERIVFSNDGLIYYTSDHYESFELLYE